MAHAVAASSHHGSQGLVFARRGESSPAPDPTCTSASRCGANNRAPNQDRQVRMKLHSKHSRHGIQAVPVLVDVNSTPSAAVLSILPSDGNVDCRYRSVRPHPGVQAGLAASRGMIKSQEMAGPVYTQQQQQQQQSQQTLSSGRRNMLRKKKSAWASAVDLRDPKSSEQQTTPQIRQKSANVTATAIVEEPRDCPIAKSMNQSAAFCDRVAARLGNVVAWLEDTELPQSQVEGLVRGEVLDYPASAEKGETRGKKDRNLSFEERSKDAGLINFQKTWLYANSRLPPHMLPFVVYSPTWAILCRAADASLAVYKRQGTKTGEYVDADWRHGTKAMMVKSTTLDEKNLIVCSIRGSKWNPIDWMVNFRPAPTAPDGFLDDPGNACHAGFLDVARAMVRPVAARLRELLEQNPSRSVSSLLITGHSAGGAVASLLYMHMMSSQISSELQTLTPFLKRVHCVTFGAPPVSFLPLQTPHRTSFQKNQFMAFANEGDLVVRAEKQYLLDLARLVGMPAPEVHQSVPQRLKAKMSRQNLSAIDSPRLQPPPFPVDDATLSLAGRVVVLRTRPERKESIEAVSASDRQLRQLVFGDPSMHSMALYQRRIRRLAYAAIDGTAEG